MTYTNVQGTRKELLSTGMMLHRTRTEKVTVFNPGPLDTGIVAIITCADAGVIGVVDAYLTASADANATYYSITGLWEIRDVYSATVGNWTTTLTDDWYNVYALDALGNIVATGIHDAVVSPGTTRTGTFDNIDPVEISAIWIVIDDDQIIVEQMAGGITFNPYNYATTHDESFHYEDRTLVINMTATQSGYGGGGWPEFSYQYDIIETSTGQNPFSSRWWDISVEYDFGGTNYRDAEYDVQNTGAGKVFGGGYGIDYYESDPFYTTVLGGVINKSRCTSCAGINFSHHGTVEVRMTPKPCHRITITNCSLYNLLTPGTFVYGTRKEVEA